MISVRWRPFFSIHCVNRTLKFFDGYVGDSSTNVVFQVSQGVKTIVVNN